MSKVWGIVIGLMLLANVSYAMKNNASPIVVSLANQTASRAITLSTPARDIIIRNQDASRYVWVDFTGKATGSGWATGLFDTGLCTLLGPDTEIDLYDFFTSSIVIFGDNAEFGPTGGASPISVEVTF